MNPPSAKIVEKRGVEDDVVEEMDIGGAGE